MYWGPREEKLYTAETWLTVFLLDTDTEADDLTATPETGGDVCK